MTTHFFRITTLKLPRLKLWCVWFSILSYDRFFSAYNIFKYTDRIFVYVQCIMYTCNIYIIHVFEWELRVLCFYNRCRLSKCIRCCICALRIIKKSVLNRQCMAVEISGVLENLQNQYSSKNSYFISDVSESIGCICVLYPWIIRKGVFDRHCKHGGRNQRFPIKSPKPIYLQKQFHVYKLL